MSSSPVIQVADGKQYEQKKKSYLYIRTYYLYLLSNNSIEITTEQREDKNFTSELEFAFQLSELEEWLTEMQRKNNRTLNY